ncbi:sugar ABC transporter permease [Arthrobacter glacialis]|uniref:Sugar ABC transporter permease n=1 Tax=Arthrobacter glacialis TaxID=1664 RepID=A0A2S3ZW78_ARTGL|nr:sugar ABC transporter permease [Arthrobacter glacialis]POH73147.1 sugar ABC transporter permease [Arthrobacter glacialis]
MRTSSLLPKKQEASEIPPPSRRTVKGGYSQPSRARLKFNDLLSKWTFLGPTTLLLLALLAYPIFYTIQISFSELNLATFAPKGWVGWENYKDAITDPGFLNSLKVTGIYLVLALPLQMVLGFGIAYLLNVEWKWRGLVRALFLIPMVVAPVVAGGVWKMLLDPLWGIVNYMLGFVGIGPLNWLGDPNLAMISIVLIDTWRWTPFIVLIASAAMLALPRDVFEAAAVDGARWWHTLIHVSLPLLASAIGAVFVVRWLGAVKMFDIALAATRGGPGQSTNVVNLYIYEEAFRSLKFAESSAMAVIVLVLTMIMTMIFLRTTKKLEDRF